MEAEISEFFILVAVLAAFGIVLYVANRKKPEED
jgi:hypothetical protein